MRYIYYCESCGFVGSDEERRKDNPTKCAECGKRLKYTGVSQDSWRSKTKEEKDMLKQEWAGKAYESGIIDDKALNIRQNSIQHLLTSGFQFEGHRIKAYHGLVSGEVVIGTGFLSEFTASVNDMFGASSEEFAQKMEKAKDAAVSKMIEKSIARGGNAIIGVSYDYITFTGNMIGVSANGTSVTAEKMEV